MHEIPSLKKQGGRKTYPPEKLREILSKIYPPETVDELMTKLTKTGESDELAD